MAKEKIDENGQPFEWAEIVPARNKGKGQNVQTAGGGWVHMPGNSTCGSRWWPNSKDPPEGWIFLFRE